MGGIGVVTEGRGITRRRMLALVGTTAALPILGACAPTSQGPAASAAVSAAPTAQPTKGPTADKIVYATAIEPSALDPGVGTGLGEEQIFGHVFDRLTAVDADQAVKPALATDWTTAADKLSWTFKLRTGVKFHDGEPFNAAAVKFTFDRLLAEAKPLANRALFASVIKGARVVDDNTVAIDLVAPFAPILQLLAIGPAGIVSPKAVGSLGDGFNRKPVGTGPFKLDSWKSGQQIVMVRNDAYWGTAPRPQQVTIRIIPEAATRVALLDTGEADIAAQLPPLDVKRLGGDPKFTVLKVAPAEVRRFMIDMQDPQFQDKRVRQAMNYAINIQPIIDSGLSGFATYSGGPFPSSMPGVVAPKYKYDLAMAKKLLADAGFANGFKTTIETVPGSSAADQEVLVAAQAQLKAVGIDAAIRQDDQAAGRLVKRAAPVPGKPKPMMDVALSVRYPDPHAALYAQYHSSSWAPAGSNYNFYKNTRVDQLLDQGLSENDPAKRAAIYKEAQEIIQDDAPSIFFATANILYVTRLKGARISPTQQLNWPEMTKS